eukprot:tig00021348_g20512.t1
MPANSTYDRAHVDELFDTIARDVVAEGPPWKVSLEAAGNNIAVETREWPSSVEPITAYRVGQHLPDVPISFATREICSRSRAEEFNKELVAADEAVALLEYPDPSDPDSLGAVRIRRHVMSYFGWRLECRFLHASRRLPDGSALAIMAFVVREGDCWTTRHMLQHARALSAWHISSAEGVSGCRYTAFALAHRSPSFLGFLPQYIISQIVCRSCAKYALTVRRLVLGEYARHCGNAGDSRLRERPSPIFASGSASAPRFRGLSVGALAEEPSSPFSLHAWAPPSPSTPSSLASTDGLSDPSPEVPGPKVNEIFYDLLGLPPPKTEPYSPRTEDSAPEGAPPSDDIRPELAEVKEPAFRSRAGEAMRASLDLALQLEAMSVTDAPPAPTRDAPPPPFIASDSSKKARSRRRSDTSLADEGDPSERAGPRGRGEAAEETAGVEAPSVPPEEGTARCRASVATAGVDAQSEGDARTPPPAPPPPIPGPAEPALSSGASGVSRGGRKKRRPLPPPRPPQPIAPRPAAAAAATRAVPEPCRTSYSAPSCGLPPAYRSRLSPGLASSAAPAPAFTPPAAVPFSAFFESAV